MSTKTGFLILASVYLASAFFCLAADRQIARPKAKAGAPTRKEITPDFTGSSPLWAKDIEKNCWGFVPDADERANAKWNGKCENQLFSGLGKISLSTSTGNLTTVSGYYERGLPQGHMRIQKNSEPLKEGYWESGIRLRLPVQKNADGEIVEAEMKSGKPDGPTLIHKEGGWVFSGVLKAGELGDRRGTIFVHKTGYWYAGGMDRDRAYSGVGTLLLPGGERYEGEFKSGLRHGWGIMQFNNGRYEGEWKDGNRHGNGKETFGNEADSYEGQWVNDKPEGYGTRKFLNGGSYQGNKKDGRNSGFGIARYANGDVYRGQYPGEGMVTKANGVTTRVRTIWNGSDWTFESTEADTTSAETNDGANATLAILNGIAQAFNNGVAQRQAIERQQIQSLQSSGNQRRGNSFVDVPPPSNKPTPGWRDIGGSNSMASDTTGGDMKQCLTVTEFRETGGAWASRNGFEIANHCASKVSISFCSTGSYRIGSNVGENTSFSCERSNFGGLTLAPGASDKVLTASLNKDGSYSLKIQYGACSFLRGPVNPRFSNGTMNYVCR